MCPASRQLTHSRCCAVDVLGVDAADGPLRLAKSLGTSADIIDARETTTEQLLNHMREGKDDGELDRAGTSLDTVIILPEGQRSRLRPKSSPQPRPNNCGQFAA